MDPKDPQTPAQNEPAAPASDPAATPPAEPQDPAAPANEPAAPAPAAPADPQAPSGAPAPAEPGQQPGNRAQQRIRQLSDKVKQGNQPSYQQPGPQHQQSPNQFDVSRYADDQGNLDVNATNQAIQAGVVQTADAIANLRVNQVINQRDAVNNFERDTEVIPTKYEELNPDNASYTPELDEAIAQEYQERAFKVVGVDQQGNAITQLDPSVRLSDIAARQIKAARAYAAKSSAGMQNRVAASADTTAPKPGGDKPADRKFEDLSLEEMKAKVGYHKV